MVERCKNTLAGVISDTSVVAIHNTMFSLSYEKLKDNSNLAFKQIGEVISADLDWSDNIPDGRIPLDVFKQKMATLAKSVPAAELHGIYEATNALPVETTLNTELLGALLIPVIGKQVLDISKQRNAGKCELRSQQGRH